MKIKIYFHVFLVDQTAGGQDRSVWQKNIQEQKKYYICTRKMYR